MPRSSPYRSSAQAFGAWAGGSGSGSSSQSARSGSTSTPTVREEDVFFCTSAIEEVFARASKSRAFRQVVSWATDSDDDDDDDDDSAEQGGSLFGVANPKTKKTKTKKMKKKVKKRQKVNKVEARSARQSREGAEAVKAALPETGPFTSQPTPAQLSRIAQVAPPTMFGATAVFRHGGAADQPAPLTMAPPPPPEPSPAELLLLRRAVAVRIFRERRSAAARRGVERSQSLKRFWIRECEDGEGGGGGDGVMEVSRQDQDDQAHDSGDRNSLTPFYLPPQSPPQPLSRWAVDQFRLIFSLGGGGAMLVRQRLSSLSMLCSTLEGAAARECRTVLGWASSAASSLMPEASLARPSFDDVALRSLQSALLEVTALPGAGAGGGAGAGAAAGESGGLQSSGDE